MPPLKNALIAQVATSWINLGAQKEFLRLQRITLQSQEESFKLMSDSYRLGASSLLELEQARTTVATARAAVAQYERSLAQAQNALNWSSALRSLRISSRTTWKKLRITARLLLPV